MLDAFANANFTIACLSLRGLIERIAVGHWLVTKISPICDIEISGSDRSWASFQSLAYRDFLSKALYGTRSDWMALAQGNFRTMKDQETLYKEIEGFMNREATNMLTRVKGLSRAVPGITIAYGVLCEFSHPNVGDLFATTKSYELSADRYGIIHHRRVVGQVGFSPERPFEKLAQSGQAEDEAERRY
jgi:hypothetical protein